MKQYLDILSDVIETGRDKSSRPGVNTKSKFVKDFRCDLRDGFPLLTTKKVNPRMVFGELVGFLKGATTIQEFHDLGCNIWDHWALKKDYVSIHPVKEDQYHLKLAEKLAISAEEAKEMLTTADAEVKVWDATRTTKITEISQSVIEEFGEGESTDHIAYERIGEYMATRPLGSREILRKHEISLMESVPEYSAGYLGPIYGKQWLEWAVNESKSINQILYVADQLANSPDSRRMVVTGWNPSDIPASQYILNPLTGDVVTNSDAGVQAAICDGKQALPPCHLMFILDTCTDASGARLLNMHVVMRSTDVPLGLPYNIASYAALTEIIAAKHGMVAAELVITMTDCHVYVDQIEMAYTQLERTPTKLPVFDLQESIDYTDPDSLGVHTVDALVEAIVGYEPQAFIKYPVAV